MEKLTELENEREENNKNIERLKSENVTLTAEILKLRYGIAPGVIVVDKNGIKYKVESVKDWGFIMPWVTGYPYKKDGAISKRLRNLYSDWTLSKET